MRRALLALALVLASSRIAFATNFYTSSSGGSDTANNCQNSAAPCDLTNGLANEIAQVMGGRGDFIYLCAGACNGAGSATITFTSGNYFLNTLTTIIPAGTSFSDALTITPYSGETITFKPIGGQGIITAYTTGLIIKGPGIIFDGADITPNNFVGVIQYLGSYERLQDVEVKNGVWSGIVAGYSAAGGWTQYQEFINLTVHDNGNNCAAPTYGSSCAPPHGIYFSGAGSINNSTTTHDLVDGGSYYNHRYPNGNASGVVCHTQSTGLDPLVGLTVRNTKIYSNDQGLEMNGGECPNWLAYNNLIYINTTLGVGVTATGPGKLYNNTIYNNNWYGINSYLGSSLEVKNNISYSNLINFNDTGSGTVCATNMGVTSGCVNQVPSNPKFTDAAGGDFTLLQDSPAIDAGTTLTDVPSDILGVTRVPPYDIGAYERTPVVGGPGSTNVRTSRATDTFTGAAGVLSGTLYTQLGTGGITCNLDGSGNLIASAVSSTDGCLTREKSGSYSSPNKLYCSIEVITIGFAEDGSDIVGCGFFKTNGDGYAALISEYMGHFYTFIAKYAAGIRNTTPIASRSDVSWVLGNTVYLSLEFNSVTNELFMLENDTVVLSPKDTTYTSGMVPGLVASGTSTGDNADFGDINVVADEGVIVVTGPGTGTLCISGATCPISWTSTNITGNLDCGYLVGGNYYSVATPAYTATPYSWTVNAPASAAAQVRCKQGAVTADGNTFTIYGTKAVFK